MLLRVLAKNIGPEIYRIGKNCLIKVKKKMSLEGRNLWVWEHLPKNAEDSLDKSWLNEGDAVENIHRLKIGGHQSGSFSIVNSGIRFPQTIQHDIDSLGIVSKVEINF